MRETTMNQIQITSNDVFVRVIDAIDYRTVFWFRFFNFLISEVLSLITLHLN